MKATLVILGVLFAYVQATSEPVTIQQAAARALTACIQEKGVDAEKIKGIMKNNILPEDNPEFSSFFVCYWKKIGIIKADNTFDNLFIKVSYPHLIKDKYPNISDADAQTLATAAVDHCDGTFKSEDLGVKGIQYRNCVIQHVIDSQA